MACLWQRIGLGCRAFMTTQSEGKPSLPKREASFLDTKGANGLPLAKNWL